MYSTCSFLGYSQFNHNKVSIPIFDHAHLKNYNQLLISANLYQHAKNKAVSSICSGNIVDLKILQLDWLSEFWPVFHEPDFSQMWHLRRNIATIIKTFIIKQIQKKNEAQFLNTLKKH